MLVKYDPKLITDWEGKYQPQKRQENNDVNNLIIEYKEIFSKEIKEMREIISMKEK